MKAIDNFDVKILRLLQKNNYTPHREIGEQVGLSVASVQRRIKRMEVEGVIEAHVSMLNPEAVGDSITFVVGVELENENIQAIDATKVLFKNMREVQQCYYVTGNVSFMLVILVKSMSEYEQLTRKMLSNKNIKKFTSYITLDRVKVGLDIPLPNE